MADTSIPTPRLSWIDSPTQPANIISASPITYLPASSRQLLKDYSRIPRDKVASRLQTGATPRLYLGTRLCNYSHSIPLT